MLDLQNQGDQEKWPQFMLDNINGLQNQLFTGYCDKTLYGDFAEHSVKYIK